MYKLGNEEAGRELQRIRIGKPQYDQVRERMTSSFSNLKNEIDRYSHKRRRAIRTPFAEEALFLHSSDSLYPVGFFFCKYVLENLVGSGYSKDFAEAYNLLIQNIPTTLEQMKDPIAYAQKIRANNPRQQ